MRQRHELDPAIAELVAGYPVLVTTMVAWGEMDANHHVNNAEYFRYIEHARLKYFHLLGFLKMQHETGIGPILSWTDCRFRRPLSYPDTITIGTRVRDIEADRFVMHTVIVSHEQKALAAEGQQRVVVYDYHKHEKALLPESIRLKIEEIERGA
jgi:acyl-CoA thioester hydrolase